jgi:CheY-like chemotaxis protein
MTRRVLLVDDDPVLLEVLATMLDLEDFEVACASGGEEALAVLAPDARERHPEVVVCDVTMPDIDGLEVCRRMKAVADTRDIPVILLTARGMQRDLDAGAAAGCDAYLTKPFSPGEFIELVRTIGRPDDATARP